MFAKRFRIGCILIVFVSQASAAVAQNVGSDYGWPPEIYQPVPPLPPGHGESYHHDSTAWGNILRGRALYLHAQGNYLLSSSQAAILFATTRAIEEFNHQQGIANRRNNIRLHKAEVQQEKAALRVRNDAKHDEKFAAAFKLTSLELDPVNGAIAWPDVLRAAAYDSLRGRLEELLREQAGYTGTSAETSNQIVRYSQSFSEVLRRNRAGIGRDDYLAAQKFLCGLKYEAELLSGAGSRDPRTTRTGDPRTAAIGILANSATAN